MDKVLWANVMDRFVLLQFNRNQVLIENIVSLQTRL